MHMQTCYLNGTTYVYECILLDMAQKAYACRLIIWDNALLCKRIVRYDRVNKCNYKDE